jgi:hypothetical protein
LFIHRVFSSLRRILPEPVARSIRAAGTALLTPPYFAYVTGHLRSSLRSKALDKHGVPIPWYTYPAIELLKAKSFDGRNVLEFGAGQSTLWWAQRADSVVSFETDPRWYEQIRRQLPSNASVYLADVDMTRFEEFVPIGASYDVVIVDGMNRLAEATKSFERVREGGVFILDNSEGYWGPAGTYPVIDLLANAGYARIDFYGFSPANIVQHCTSFFFRGSCFLFDSRDHPVSQGTLNRYGDGR